MENNKNENNYGPSQISETTTSLQLDENTLGDSKKTKDDLFIVGVGINLLVLIALLLLYFFNTFIFTCKENCEGINMDQVFIMWPLTLVLIIAIPTAAIISLLGLLSKQLTQKERHILLGSFSLWVIIWGIKILAP